MPVVTRRELLEAGVHFGHQTRRWNPKMGRYLYGERSGIYIIDLEKTLSGLEEAYAYARDLGRRGGVILFVGTKKQAQEVISEHAARVGMPFVTTRWLGGMLTNFQTVSRRLLRLRELREMERTGAFDFLPKREAIRLRHEKEKLERNLGGMQSLDRLPEAIFVIDTKKEHIAVNEARKLGISVIAIVDTNCDPDEVDFVIPGNDDAIRSVSLVTRLIADALAEGRQEGREAVVTRATGPEIEPEPVPPNPLRGRPGRRGARADRPRGRPGPRGRADGSGLTRMAEISAQLVKELRDRTGAGMMECKKALQEADGDLDKAEEILRTKGLASAAGRADRSANQGLIQAYVHFNNTVGAMVEVNCETDFVANTDEFKQLAKDLALHIASPSAPKYVSRDEVAPEELASERRIFEAQAREMGKPDDVVPRIVEGKLKTFYAEAVLLDQPYVKDDSKTIQQLLDEMSSKVGEKVAVRRFVRYRLGEETG